MHKMYRFFYKFDILSVQYVRFLGKISPFRKKSVVFLQEMVGFWHGNRL